MSGKVVPICKTLRRLERVMALPAAKNLPSLARSLVEHSGLPAEKIENILNCALESLRREAIAERKLLHRGASMERERIKAILKCPEAIGQQDEAMTIAFDSNATVGIARERLSTMQQIRFPGNESSQSLSDTDADNWPN
jgi:hypothetical protein